MFFFLSSFLCKVLCLILKKYYICRLRVLSTKLLSLICLGLSPLCPKYFSQNQKRENRLKSRPGAGAYTTRSWRTPIRGLLMKTEMRVCLHLIKSFLLHKLHHRPHTFFRDFFFLENVSRFFSKMIQRTFLFFFLHDWLMHLLIWS